MPQQLLRRYILSRSSIVPKQRQLAKIFDPVTSSKKPLVASVIATRQLATSTMPGNRAAFLPASDGSPLEIRSSSYTAPGPDQITVKNSALGINPIDGGLQMNAFLPFQHPAILGFEVAGTVSEVGPGAETHFKVGDRVCGSTTWLFGSVQAQGAFQEYTVLRTNMAGKIPDALSFEKAACVPLGYSTAAGALFQEDHLALQSPSLDPRPTGETLLVWGGATSPGVMAIQLAVAAGYEVFVTCSPKNNALCERLGAARCFDYNSETVSEDLIAAFRGKKCAGAFDIPNVNEKVLLSANIIAAVEGNKLISSAKSSYNQLPKGVSLKRIHGSSLANSEVGRLAWQEYFGTAMASGKLVAEPPPRIVGQGLESLQNALETRRKGDVSAQKLIVTL